MYTNKKGKVEQGKINCGGEWAEDEIWSYSESIWKHHEKVKISEFVSM